MQEISKCNFTSYLRKGSNNKDKALKTSNWLHKMLITNWPEQADEIIKAMLTHPNEHAN